MSTAALEAPLTIGGGRDARPRPVVARARDVRALATALPVIGLVLLWTADSGGYAPVMWLSGALAILVLGAWMRFVFGRLPRPGPHVRWALIALGLYVVWSYVSIAWATDPGAAEMGSNRALLYLAVFVLFALLQWTPSALERVLLAYVLGLGALAAVALAELALGPAPHLLQAGQLAVGLGYHNATAAMGTVGAAGSILLGSSRRFRPLTRAALAASATACLEIALLAQSRGWLYTLPVIVVILLSIVPARARVTAWALLPVGAAVMTLPWVLHGYRLIDSLSGPAADARVASADVATAQVALCAALVSGVIGWLLARCDRRYELSWTGRRVKRHAARAMLTLVVLGAVGSAAIVIGSGAAARGWRQFTTDAPLRSRVSRFAELGSGRYDFWRVALENFARHPLGGLGQDNFAETYVGARHTGEEPAWVHSLELRLLTHTGGVGFALFAAFALIALSAVRRAARTMTHAHVLMIAVALVPVTVWLVHGSVDWFWEIPALSAPAFALLGAAAALDPNRPLAIDRGRPMAVMSGAAAIAAGVAAVVVLAPAYLAERDLQSASALAGRAPRAALSKLAGAAGLEPFSSAPLLLSAAIELRTGNYAEALSHARAGLARDPSSWVLWLEAGLAARAQGQPGTERSALAHAHSLDPREPVIALAQRRASTDRPLTISELAAMFASRVNARVGT